MHEIWGSWGSCIVFVKLLAFLDIIDFLLIFMLTSNKVDRLIVCRTLAQARCLRDQQQPSNVPAATHAWSRQRKPC